MQYRVAKMAVILDEMDVVFVEGCALYCVQYNKPLKTVRITRNVAVFNSEEAVTTSFNTVACLCI
jgi:hypothetical protein